MGLFVSGGALLQCSFGMAPSTLMLTPANKLISSMPLAVITDNLPMLNIMPFGMCSSMANPTVAAATAAALGVLTPMPCLPLTTAPWAPGCPTVLVCGKPALNNSSKCLCAYGGVISVNNPGQTSIQIP